MICEKGRQLDTEPRAGSGVVRIDPLRFLAGCRTRRLNQALSVLSLSLGFFWCICCAVNYRDSFYVVLFLCSCVFSLLVVLVRLSVPVQVIDWKDSSPKWPLLVGTLNHTHSLTHSLTQSLTLMLLVYFSPCLITWSCS